VASASTAAAPWLRLATSWITLQAIVHHRESHGYTFPLSALGYGSSRTGMIAAINV